MAHVRDQASGARGADALLRVVAGSREDAKGRTTPIKAARFLVFLILLVGVTSAAEAALIYGTIKADAVPLANHELALACARASYPARTDERGSYSINPHGQGRCTLSLTYEGRRLAYTVYSQAKPARYDLVVVRGADGGFILRRK